MGWGGNLNLGGRIDIRSAERLDADIVLERGSGDLHLTDELGGVQALGISDLRLALSAHDGLWQLAQGLAGTSIGTLAGAQLVTTPPTQRWPQPRDALQGVLQARVSNLGVWGVWVPPGWRLSGSLDTQGLIGGTLGAPQLRGRLDGRQLGLRNTLQGVNLSDGELAVVLEGDTTRIERAVFKGGDGQIRITGGMTLGEQPTLQIDLDADRFKVLGRIDRRLVASGRSSLRMNRDQLWLDGRLRVDEGLFDISRGDAPQLDGDVVVHRQPERNDPANAGPATVLARGPAVVARPVRQTQVNLLVDLGDRLRLRGRGVDTGLRGTLQLAMPGGQPTVTGTVRTHEGRYAAYGQKLEISRGEFSFNGPLDNPRVDVLAVRPNLDVTVGVAVTGAGNNPRVRLYSEPEMSDYDKLSWLMLGRSPDGLGNADTALLQRAALALLAGDQRTPAGELLDALGLADFSVRQSTGDSRETIVSLGKQLSRRWYVGYERSVNATLGTWQLVYRVAQRFTLRAQSGNENAVDLIWTWRW
jgi:translocation and assembly module TamB